MTFELYYLSEDVLFLIWDFVCNNDKIVLCKQFYIRYHCDWYREKMLFNQNYLFFIIKNKFDFVVERLLIDNKNEMIQKNNKISYKEYTFHTKIAFLEYYASIIEKSPCNNLIKTFIIKNRLKRYRKYTKRGNKVF